MCQWIRCFMGDHDEVKIHPIKKEYPIFICISCKRIRDLNINEQKRLTRSELAMKIYEESNAKSSS